MFTFVCIATCIAIVFAVLFFAQLRRGPDSVNAGMIAEKEEGYRRLLATKDEAMRRALEEKDRSCRQLLIEKDESIDRLIKAKDEATKRALEEKDIACKQLLNEKDESIKRFHLEKEKTLAESVKILKEQFANLAADILKSRSADLSAENKTQLDFVLKPIKEQFVRLEEITRKAQAENENLGKSMAKDVDAIGKIARELSGVATALTSNTRIQGRTGEDILAEKLRQAGLEENVSFFLQQGTDENRPDAQVKDPENRWLIIDSKVSLTAFMQYEQATDGESKASFLSAHVLSVKQKIEQLAKKKYPVELSKRYLDRDYLPITAMFIPYEAPLMVALKADPSLWQYAAENNVFLVTPLTLLAYLRLVYLAWQHEKESRNQQAILDTARELLARMNNFLEAFEGVGKTIVQLQDAYQKAGSVIIDAPHAQTIAKSAKKLLDLHVRLENAKGRKLNKAKCLLNNDEIVECEQSDVV